MLCYLVMAMEELTSSAPAVHSDRAAGSQAILQSMYLCLKRLNVRGV